MLIPHRRVTLHLTEDAHAAARAQVRPMAATVTELARAFTPAEREPVARFLDALLAIVTDAGDPPAGS